LIRKSFFSRYKIGNKTAIGKCLSIILSLDTGLDVNIVTVYFPCYRSSFSYSNDLAECLSYLEDVLSNGKPSVIIGDMNFPCDFNNEGFSQCHNVLSCYRVFQCDEFINSENCIT